MKAKSPHWFNRTFGEILDLDGERMADFEGVRKSLEQIPSLLEQHGREPMTHEGEQPIKPMPTLDSAPPIGIVGEQCLGAFRELIAETVGQADTEMVLHFVRNNDCDIQRAIPSGFLKRTDGRVLCGGGAHVAVLSTI